MALMRRDVWSIVLASVFIIGMWIMIANQTQVAVVPSGVGRSTPESSASGAGGETTAVDVGNVSLVDRIKQAVTGEGTATGGQVISENSVQPTSAKGVEVVVLQQLQGIIDCFDQEIAAPEYPRIITLSVLIEDVDDVGVVTELESTIAGDIDDDKNEAFDGCVKNLMIDAVFTKPARPLNVRYPLVFSVDEAE